MTTVALSDLKLDASGYLVDYRAWTPKIAELLARQEGIVLTDRHWLVIYFARDEYMKSGEAPTLRRTTREAGVSTREMYDLFPGGPATQAARIAGLKRPTGCL